MRRIFVPLHGPDDVRPLLELARQLASPSGAAIEAAWISERAGLEDEPPAAPDSASARSVFEAWAAGLDAGAVRTGWREIPDGAVYAGASLGRACDLVVTRSLGRPGEEPRIVAAGIDSRGFRDALLACGRLTLLAPPRPCDPVRLLDHVVVAWDGSAGASHALGQALPLVQRAGSVHVVIVGRNTVGVRAREAIGSYVALHNASARLVVRENAHRQTGRVLLEALREEAASLVVMGVRGRSHPAGEGSLGGTILKVIEDGRIPIATVG